MKSFTVIFNDKKREPEICIGRDIDDALRRHGIDKDLVKSHKEINTKSNSKK